MEVFESKYHTQKIDEYLQFQINKNPPKKSLLIILIGDDAASLKYISVKIKLCEKLGIKVRLERFSETLTDVEISLKVVSLFNSPDIGGGIIQIPLSRESLYKILELIPIEKDVDLLSSTKIDRYYNGDFSCLPPVVRACNYWLLQSSIGDTPNVVTCIDIKSTLALLTDNIAGKKITILGSGRLVGKPIFNMMNYFGAQVISNENYHKGDKIYSDYLILGTGIPNLVRGEDVSENCHILDFGTAKIGDKVVGDFDRESETGHLGKVSFSPGGIGPVVVRFLLLNFCDITS